MILIAEDEMLNKLLLERVVAKLGYQAKIVENGQDVIALCEKEDFNLLIIDISMPIIDGLEAIEYIRNQPNKNKNTPILLLSGTYPQNFKELQKEHGISGIIIKPFSLLDISKCIEENYKK